MSVVNMKGQLVEKKPMPVTSKDIASGIEGMIDFTIAMEQARKSSPEAFDNIRFEYKGGVMGVAAVLEHVELRLSAVRLGINARALATVIKQNKEAARSEMEPA